MNIWLKLLIAIVFVVASACTRAEIGKDVDCDAPELFCIATDDGVICSDLIEYNVLICAGVRQMEAKEYKAAVKSFEAAAAMHLFEYPNFKLLPRLAWAYFKAGERKKAEDTLAKAELTLAVYAGMLRCVAVEEEPYFYLVEVETILDHLDREDGVFYLERARYDLHLTGEFIDEVKSIMCGAIYDQHYDRDYPDRVLWEAKLVQRYLDVKRRIEKEMTSE